jgi:TubC N-terminal docking domain
MDAIAYIQKVSAAGFSLACDGDRLLVSPIENLTDAERRSLAEHKTELLAALRASEAIIDADGGNDLEPANDRVQIHVPEYPAQSGQRYSFDMTVPRASLPALSRTSLKFMLKDDQGGGSILGKPGATEDEVRAVLLRKYGGRLATINGAEVGHD